MSLLALYYNDIVRYGKERAEILFDIRWMFWYEDDIDMYRKYGFNLNNMLSWESSQERPT